MLDQCGCSGQRHGLTSERIPLAAEIRRSTTVLTIMRNRAGVLVGLLAMTGATMLATATPASAHLAVAAATPVIFDLNGTYSDGGSARPVISNNNDVLTVNMSSQHRPTATGVVINSDTILVTFPDDATYTAKLQAPGTIRWSNGSAWAKTRAVPSVIGDTVSQASTALSNAGFRIGSVSSTPDRTCENIGTILRQSPGANSQNLPGTAVNVTVGSRPPTPCP